MGRVSVGLIVFLLVSTVWPSATTALSSIPAASATTSFSPVTCSVFAPGLVADRCGYVIVPEDRMKPGGRMIQLAIALFKSRSSTHAPDPIVLLAGGPGAALIATAGVTAGPSLLQVFGARRDLILVDQRGTGFSRPSLSCPEMSTALVSLLDQHLSQAQVETRTLQAVRRCHDRLVGEGVDVTAYTTLSDAADIAALGPALGYKTVNLIGMSYGTRLALTVMHLYPAALRSVILDSVLPPQVNAFPTALTSQAHILAKLLAACAADAPCQQEHPHFGSTLSAVVTRLNRHPATIPVTVPTTGQTSTVVLTGDLLWDLVFNQLYSSTNNGSVFLMVATAGHGNYDLASQAAGQYVAQYDDPATLALGLRLSDECSEDAPATSPAQLAAAAQALPSVLRVDALADQLRALRECRIWQVRPAPAWQRSAVHSTIPTLILTGEDDPITPPALGKLAAQTLPHSFLYTFPGRGHGQLSSGDATCPRQISAAFLRQPTRRPGGACIAGMPALSME